MSGDVIYYALLDDHGVVVGNGEAWLMEDLQRSAPEGTHVRLLREDEVPVPGLFYLGADQRFHELPPRPGPQFAWRNGAWVDPRSAADIAAQLYAAREATALDKSELLTRMLMSGLLPVSDIEAAGEGRIPPSLEPALAMLPPEAQVVARIKWRNDPVISRTNPVIVLAGAALGMSEEQLDTLFGVVAPI